MMKDQREYKKDVFGFGSGGYWGEKDYHPKSRMHELEWEPHQGHNGYHDIKLTMGYAGIILFILFLVHYFRNIFRVLSNRNIFMLFMSVIFCINNITESSFFRGKHFFFVLLMLIFWYTVFKNKDEVDDAREEEETAPDYQLQPVAEAPRIDDFKRR
jgi:O-antigen ligase